MDWTNRDEDDGADVSLDETLPSEDSQSASLSRETRATGETQAVIEIDKGSESGAMSSSSRTRSGSKAARSAGARPSPR